MDIDASGILRRYEQVLNDIALAVAKSGRIPAHLRLLVVTKAHPREAVRAVVEAGARYLGENYPEESIEKIEGLKDIPGLEWHMIGHLQSRKAKIVCDHFSMLQSLDRLSLAEKLERLMAERGRVLPVLLQFNVGGEESKSGWDASDEARWPELLPIFEQLAACRHLKPSGLMTMPPLETEPEAARSHFSRLRRLRDYFYEQIPGLDLHELSMGTSVDYQAAIEEGSSIVRIGTAIMGERAQR